MSGRGSAITASLAVTCVLAALGAAAAAFAVTSQAPDTPSGISFKARGDGWVFTDARGMTLYTFDRDEGTPGASSCDGDCATMWPPVLAAADAKPSSGAWTQIARANGTKQWAFRGKPLYRYAADESAGSVFGDGVDTVWRIALKPIPVPRDAGIGGTILGQVLTDARGLTLYVSDADRAGKAPSCKGSCLTDWQPLAAPWAARAFADWSIVTRDDGLKQWAYQGKPLYSRRGTDVIPGEVTGHDRGGWKAVVLEPMPPLPSWVTIRPSDAGELLADQNGLTIYTHGDNARGRRRYMGQLPGCTGDCVDDQWTPILAAPDAKPVGSWAVVDAADGRKQWAYKGQKLYLNVLDKKPGDFRGIRFGGDRSWSAIMRDGEPMQGVSVGG